MVTQAGAKQCHLRSSVFSTANRGQASGDLTLAFGLTTWLSPTGTPLAGHLPPRLSSLLVRTDGMGPGMPSQPIFALTWWSGLLDPRLSSWSHKKCLLKEGFPQTPLCSLRQGCSMTPGLWGGCVGRFIPPGHPRWKWQANTGLCLETRKWTKWAEDRIGKEDAERVRN